MDITDDESFRRAEWRGDSYLVGPVVAQREGIYQYPDGRDVSEELVTAETLTDDLDAWEDTPLVVRHPTDGGDPLTVNEAGDTGDTAVADVGAFRNVRETSDGDGLAGEVWIREDAIGDHDGDLRSYLERLRDGDYGEVSTGYTVDEFRGAGGRTNGHDFDDEQTAITPDHLALLPDEIGNCPVAEAGPGSQCGVGRANQAVRVNTEGPESRQNKRVAGVTFDGTKQGSLDESEIPTDDFEAHYLEPGENKSSSSFPVVDADGYLRRDNVASAFRFRGEASDTGELVDNLATLNRQFDTPPVDEDTVDEAQARTNAAAVDPDSLGQTIANAIRGALGRNDTDEEQGGAEPADADTGSDADTADSTESDDSMDDSEKIDILVEEHDFDRENLEAWEGEDCLTRTFERFTETVEDTTAVDAEEDADEVDDETPEEELTPDGSVSADDPDATDEGTESAETVAVNKADVKDVVGEVLAEREQKEKKSEHVDTLASNDDAPFERDELESMDADSLSILVDKFDSEEETETPRANYAGRPTGSAARANSSESESAPAAGFDNWNSRNGSDN